jgi:hypothetical protein
MALTATRLSLASQSALGLVRHEDDVKFVGLCDARSTSLPRIGATDNSNTREIQEVAGWKLGDLSNTHKGPLA